MSNKFKLVCNKQDILLEHNNDTNIYSLIFNIENDNFDKKKLLKLLDSNIFILLKNLNSDTISDIIEIYNKDNENIILFILNNIAKDFGIKQKFMFLHNIKNEENDKIIYNTKSVSKNYLLSNKLLSNNILDKILNLDEIVCEFATLSININELNNIKIYYLFKIILNDELPEILKHFIGLFMKKIFLNFKLHIMNTIT